MSFGWVAQTSPVALPFNFQRPVPMWFVSDEEGYVWGNGGGGGTGHCALWKWNGATWTDISFSSPANNEAIGAWGKADGSAIYFATTQNGIFTSTDHGASWTLTVGPTGGGVQSFTGAQSGGTVTWFAGVGSGKLYVSNNLGSSWTEIDGGVIGAGSLQRTAWARTPTDVWFGGDDGAGTGQLVHWNGTAATKIGIKVDDHVILASVYAIWGPATPTTELYIGGEFSFAEGSVAIHTTDNFGTATVELLPHGDETNVMAISGQASDDVHLAVVRAADSSMFIYDLVAEDVFEDSAAIGVVAGQHTSSVSVWENPSGTVYAVGNTGQLQAYLPPALMLESATAIATNTVQVTTSTPPLAQSAIGIGDALNPATWSIIRTDTGAAFDVMAVVPISDVVFNIIIYERFAASLIQHQVSTTTLVDPFGFPVQAPTSETFRGVIASTENTQEAKTANRNFVISDLANPPFPRPGNTVGGGVRVLNASGDFSAVSGNALVEKLILRRLGTNPGGFFHLPNYGLGIQTKGFLRSTDMVTLKKNVQDQVALEPEVAAVNASLLLDPVNQILTITMQVRTTFGTQMVVSTNVSTAGQPF